jgi:5-methyltetrahydrofolate--homocysteine methyltransferase
MTIRGFFVAPTAGYDGVMGRDFLQALRSGRVLLMDGAMGTELQRAGMKPNECYELWNVTHPGRVQAIHRAYVGAGAEVLLTNTFQANPTVFRKHGLDARVEEISTAGVALARNHGAKAPFVGASIGPYDAAHADIMRHGWTAYASMVRPLLCADALVFETCSDVIATACLCNGLPKAISKGVKHLHDMVKLVSFSFFRDAKGELRTGAGFTPRGIAIRIPRKCAGVAALGVNCGRDITIDDCAEILRRYRTVTDLPLFARPNAGTPTRVGDQWVYPHSPEQMAAKLPALLEAGATMIGGCCGTTPAHIAAFRPVIDAWNARRAGGAF